MQLEANHELEDTLGMRKRKMLYTLARTTQM